MKKFFEKLFEWVLRFIYCGLITFMGFTATYTFFGAFFDVLDGVIGYVNEVPDAWSQTEVNLAMTCLLFTFFLIWKAWNRIFSECSKCINDEWGGKDEN